jgi:hypothetical protein
MFLICKTSNFQVLMLVKPNVSTGRDNFGEVVRRMRANFKGAMVVERLRSIGLSGSSY